MPVDLQRPTVPLLEDLNLLKPKETEGGRNQDAAYLRTPPVQRSKIEITPLYLSFYIFRITLKFQTRSSNENFQKKSNSMMDRQTDKQQVEIAI